MNQEKYNAAMDKLRDELAQSTSGRYVQVVGEYLTSYLREPPDAADKILAKGLTIKGSLAAMRDEAAKHKEGQVAILDDKTAFGIVLKYFRIKDEGDGGTTSDPFDLDALLEVM